MPPPLTDARLREELRRCQSCEAKPCRGGCPAGLSPADFILAVRCGEPSDFRRAAAHVLGHNPLGGVCGAVCPDTLCMARCVRRAFDAPVNIPAIQAAIVDRARRLGVLPRFEPLPATGHRVAVVGAGPAGLGAASVLAKAGHAVHVLDRARRAGGMVRLIPRHRLDPGVLEGDLAWLLGLGDVSLVLGQPVPLPRDLLARGYAAVVVAAGLADPVALDVPGGERALPWTALLGEAPPSLEGRRVAVVGDGPVAVDCALAAQARGAAHVELLALRKLSELALTRAERDRLFESGVHLSGRVRVAAIRGRGARVTALALRKVDLPAGEAYHPSRLVDLPHGEHERRDLDVVVAALGGRAGVRLEPHPRVLYAGDLEDGPTTVVEALASGKRAGQEVHRMLAGHDAACPERASCADGSGCPRRATCPEWDRPAAASAAGGGARAAPGLPVPLDADVLGRPVSSPFLLAAGAYTARYAPLRRAYEAGWAGAVMALPGGGEDAVDAACRDLERLGREFPGRLTLVRAELPAGGEGDGEGPARAWQASARRLEAAGAMGLEVAACGTGAVDAVLGAGLRVPTLFRLPAGIPATDRALAAVAAALARHPGARAGVTLTGPRFADPVRHGLFASADAGPMDYRAAATLLARGARVVQVSSVVARYGLGVVSELHAGLSWFLAERGLRSVSALAGAAALLAASSRRAPEGVSTLDARRCTACGNCARCAFEAIALDGRGLPAVDPARCTGCGACVAACFAGALSLRPRGAA